MKIGMPILFGYDSLEDNFRLADKLGFDFVELNLNFSYCRREMLDSALIGRLIEKYAKEITLHFFDEGDFGTYEEVAGGYYVLLEKYLGAISPFKPVNLIIHMIEGPVATVSGVKNYVYEKEFGEYSERLLKMLGKVKKLCGQSGTSLALENSKTVPYMKKTYALLSREGYSFAFDAGHNEMSSGLVSDFYAENPFDIKEFHIHDVMRKSDGALTDHVDLGKGRINLKEIKAFAEKTGAYALLELKSPSDLAHSVEYFGKL